MSLRNVVETLCSQRQDTRSNPEDIRSRFYEDYRKVAEEYDKEFMKRYDEDLNTTLIFVSLFIFLSRSKNILTRWPHQLCTCLSDRDRHFPHPSRSALATSESPSSILTGWGCL